MPCNDNSKYGTVILKDKGVCIKLRSNNPFSNDSNSELIKYTDILSVRYDKGFTLSRWPKLYIETSTISKKISINVAERDLLKQFVDELNSHIQEIKTQEKPPEQSLGEKLKEAKELLDIGALSQEEFDEIKQRYLKEF
ncbi:SHOCT domain-containing protein [Methanobacterium formicicum]|uniref:SHOCT domain-containing protein n=1 Tax=Methanobacterium formicicum TaxID=2162 RepID=UPI001ED9A23A|nr:SHOCT domain-containing protein [Methanobacterium formicicum]